MWYIISAKKYKNQIKPQSLLWRQLYSARSLFSMAVWGKWFLTDVLRCVPWTGDSISTGCLAINFSYPPFSSFLPMQNSQGAQPSDFRQMFGNISRGSLASAWQKLWDRADGRVGKWLHGANIAVTGIPSNQHQGGRMAAEIIPQNRKLERSFKEKS